MDKEELLRKMRVGNFVENNGKVLRTINLLRHKYIKLKSVENALTELCEQEFLDCVNFLSREGYIGLRNFESKKESLLSDSDYESLEAVVLGKGIRLLGGEIFDKMVEV
jgi:hypothetical protein